jgi:DNA-binding NtrC family response regulator
VEKQLSNIVASSNDEDVDASASHGVDCVFLSCFDNNALFFTSMLGQGGIRLHHACTLEMADFLLLATRATVLVMDTTFLDGSWEDALSMTRRLHPLVASLICVDPIDGELIASAQELGGLGALRMPIELERLRSTIWNAHTVTVERRLWLSEREHEYRSNARTLDSVRDAVK